MKRIYVLWVVLLLTGSTILWPQEAAHSSVKSIETKAYKAETQNGAIIKGKIYTPSMLQNFYPISIASPSKEEYNNQGQLIVVTDLDDDLEPKSIEHYYYNDKKAIVKAVGFVPKFQDSMVGQWTYDSIGNLEKFRISKTKLGSDNWFKNLFGKVYLANYQNKDFHNYYLTNNDSTNIAIKNDFENLKLVENDVYILFDTKNQVVEKRVMETENLNEANLIIKKMDTAWISRTYKYNILGKIVEDITVYNRHINNRGRLKKRSRTYEYTNDNKLKIITTVADYNPIKMTLMPKAKEKTIISKEVHDYLDEGKTQIVSFYENDKLEKKVTEIFDVNGKLQEQLSEKGNRKLQLKFDAHEKLISYIRYRKSKIVDDFKLEYVYNDHGDWTQCIHYDNVKNKALVIEERTIDYFGQGDNYKIK